MTTRSRDHKPWQIAERHLSPSQNLNQPTTEVSHSRYVGASRSVIALHHFALIDFARGTEPASYQRSDRRHHSTGTPKAHLQPVGATLHHLRLIARQPRAVVVGAELNHHRAASPANPKPRRHPSFSVRPYRNLPSKQARVINLPTTGPSPNFGPTSSLTSQQLKMSQIHSNMWPPSQIHSAVGDSLHHNPNWTGILSPIAGAKHLSGVGAPLYHSLN